MKTIQDWLDAYGVSHQNSTNKLIHWICVPAIMFSLLGLLYSLPVFGDYKSLLVNWAAVLVVVTLIFYARLSFSIFAGFIFIGGAMLWFNHELAQSLGTAGHAWLSFAIFFAAWVGQFIGHKIEGEKPSFFEDLQFLLVGPAWLLSFIYKKVGISL